MLYNDATSHTMWYGDAISYRTCPETPMARCSQKQEQSTFAKRGSKYIYQTGGAASGRDHMHCVKSGRVAPLWVWCVCTAWGRVRGERYYVYRCVDRWTARCCWIASIRVAMHWVGTRVFCLSCLAFALKQKALSSRAAQTWGKSGCRTQNVTGRKTWCTHTCT